MTEAVLHKGPPIDVAVIGAGPAGLAAATALKKAGVARVVVLEREPEAGGIPRHCNHFPFGAREFGRVLKGPQYAARIVATAGHAGVEIHSATSVTDIQVGGCLTVSTLEGAHEIAARRVVYATGVRETPRSARLISGVRTQGVVNTGALQSMVYLKHRRPFRRPVIVGTELVAFSALLTCRSAGIQPVAMIEAQPAVTARWPSPLFPRLRGVKLFTGTELAEIIGNKSVEAVAVMGSDGATRHLECDGVILTGQFTPEIALGRCGHLDVDPATGGPVVDQWGRCSDPVYFATGNVLRAVETAGKSWAEGQRTGEWVARDLIERLPNRNNSVSVVVRDRRLKYAMPQLICKSSEAPAGMTDIQMRVTEPVSGSLIARAKGQLVWRGRLNTRPERRITAPVAAMTAQPSGAIEFTIEGATQ